MNDTLGTRYLPLALLVAALLPAPAYASLFAEARGDGYGAAQDSYGNGPQNCSYGYNTIVSSGSCLFTNNGAITVYPYTGEANSFTGDMYSSVGTDGSLHAYASAAFTNYPGSTYAQTEADATVGDTLTFNAPGPAVATQIVMKVTLDGVFKEYVPEDDAGLATLTFDSNRGTYYDTSSGGDTFTMPAISVSSGASYSYTLELAVQAEIACDTNDSVLVLCSSTDSADFSNTAQISQIIVEDMNGNPLSGYTVTSDSGINYNSLVEGDPSAAPEPGYWGLTALLLAAGLGKWRKTTFGLK